MITKMAAGSVIALAAAVLVATPAQGAPGHYAGIAYSPPEGTFGWVNHVNSEDDAIDGSIDACSKKGGSACSWQVWAQDDDCLALLADPGPDSYAGGIGATPKQAIKDANAQAQKNGLTIKNQTPLVQFCMDDQGPDQG
jgi:hypothetical protein